MSDTSHSDRFAFGVIGVVVLAFIALLIWWLGVWVIAIPVGAVVVATGVYAVGWVITAVTDLVESK